MGSARDLRVDESRVLGDVFDEGGKRRVAEKGLDEGTVACVFLGKGSVLGLESGDFLSLGCDLAFKLANVFYETLAMIL